MKPDDQSGPEHERIEDPNASTVTVDLEDDDEDEDQEDEGDAEPPRAAKGDKDQPRDKSTGKWTQKKQERQREHKERTAWREEKAAFERRMADERAAYQRQLAELTARAAAPAQQQTPSDPYEAKLNEIEAAMEAELKLIEADESRGLKRYNQLRRDEQRTLIEQATAKQQQAQRVAQAAAPQRNTQYDARKPFIESEFPWTMDPRMADLNKKAWTYRSYLIEVEGRPDTIDTDREALSHIQAQYGGNYGLRAPARPSRETRERYVRPASGGPPEREGSRPSRMEIPSHLVEGSGLDAAALARALKDL